MITLAAFAPADLPEDVLWPRFAAGGADLEGKIVLGPFMGGRDDGGGGPAVGAVVSSVWTSTPPPGL